MLEKFKHIIYSDIPEIKNRQVFLAISGGIDSVVLCHLLSEVKLKFTLLHCNFTLRGEESNSDQQFVEKLALKLKTPFLVRTFDTKKESEKSKTNIQLTARNLRYAWFNEISKTIEDPLILTAHHADDNIETFLLNLLRGTSIKGASGIPKFRDVFYRPLLTFNKADLLCYAEQNNIEFRNDSSNNEVKYKRNLLRNKIIPDLEKINSSFKENMSNFIKDMIIVNKNLDEFSNQFISKNLEVHCGYSSVLIDKLVELSDIQLSNLFDSNELYRAKIIEFRKFLKSSTGSVFRTKNTEFLNNRDSILFRPISNHIEIDFVYCNELPFTFSFGHRKFNIKLVSAGEVNFNSKKLYVDFKNVSLPLTIRQLVKEEKFQPFGSKNTKLISDILINKKINMFQKESTFIIEDVNLQKLFLDTICSTNSCSIDESTTSILEFYEIE